MFQEDTNYWMFGEIDCKRTVTIIYKKHAKKIKCGHFILTFTIIRMES